MASLLESLEGHSHMLWRGQFCLSNCGMSHMDSQPSSPEPDMVIGCNFGFKTVKQKHSTSSKRCSMNHHGSDAREVSPFPSRSSRQSQPTQGRKSPPGCSGMHVHSAVQTTSSTSMNRYEQIWTDMNRYEQIWIGSRWSNRYWKGESVEVLQSCGNFASGLVQYILVDCFSQQSIVWKMEQFTTVDKSLAWISKAKKQNMLSCSCYHSRVLSQQYMCIVWFLGFSWGRSADICGSCKSRSWAERSGEVVKSFFFRSGTVL